MLTSIYVNPYGDGICLSRRRKYTCVSRMPFISAWILCHYNSISNWYQKSIHNFHGITFCRRRKYLRSEDVLHDVLVLDGGRLFGRGRRARLGRAGLLVGLLAEERHDAAQGSTWWSSCQQQQGECCCDFTHNYSLDNTTLLKYILDPLLEVCKQCSRNQSTFYCVSTRMPPWCTRNIVEISTAWNTIFVYPFFYFFWTSQHTHTIFYCHSAWPGTLPTASLVPLSSNLLTWLFTIC